MENARFRSHIIPTVRQSTNSFFFLCLSYIIVCVGYVDIQDKKYSFLHDNKGAEFSYLIISFPPFHVQVIVSVKIFHL